MTSTRNGGAERAADDNSGTKQLVSELFSDIECVFLSRPDRLKGASSPTFGDPVWDPDGVIPRRPNVTRAQVRITFPAHPAWSLRSREVAMALLNPADPRLLARSVSFGSRTYAITHAKGRCESYKTAAAWQVEKGLADDITVWSHDNWTSMVESEITKGAKNGTVRNLINAIRDLVALSPILTGGGIASDPWNGQPTLAIAKGAHKGRTEVMAPDRWIPLIGACWTYINVFADDILSLRESHRCALRWRMPPQSRRRDTYDDLLNEYLESVDAVIPMRKTAGGDLEANWERLSRLVTADQVVGVFKLGKGPTGQVRRQLVYDAIADGDVLCQVMSVADFRALLARRVYELDGIRCAAAGPRTSEADEIVQTWIDQSENSVALRRDCGGRTGQQLTDDDVNWSMMENIVYGNDKGELILLGRWDRGRRRRELILAAAQSGRTFVADKGVMSAQRACAGFALVEGPDGRSVPWRESMSDYEARCELRALRAACYVFVAAMTMMRDSELQSIKRGSITVHYGVPAVRSSTYKGRRAETTAHWWIVDEVATAIGVLERLSTHPEYLFASFVDGDHEDAEPGIRTVHEFGFLFEHLAATGARSGLAPIPDDTWVSPRMLRRTTACISRELGGNELAVSQQLKHVISYGYSNVTASYMAPDPAWSNLLNTNRSEENLGHMVDMIQESRQSSHPLAGRGGERLTDAIVDASTSTAAAGGQGLLMSDAQLAALLKKIAPVIRFGPANACLWDEETALCRRTAMPDTQGPLLGLCQPARCANSVVGAEHLPVWISELQMLRATIADNRLSPPRRQALSDRLADVEQVLDDANVDADREQR
jgi:integrase